MGQSTDPRNPESRAHRRNLRSDRGNRREIIGQATGRARRPPPASRAQRTDRKGSKRFQHQRSRPFHNGQTHPPPPTRLWRCRCKRHRNGASELGGDQAKRGRLRRSKIRPRWRTRIPTKPLASAENSEPSRPRRVRLGYCRRCPPKTRGRNRGGQSECEKGGYRGDRDGDWRSSVLSGEPMPFFGGAGRGSVTPSGPQVYRPLPKNGGDT
ncbi:hypothetical protein GBAR_LOCUS16471 [Geodia barretti]|uniref:Uncharacterized protein n=1 Tax=Geodia barretti TaxID=519541 RepID=A0AA35WQF1_GEOBA|nr:hypothetical protein GBAR_LOCUS16471 [Geodia barretti]